MDLSALMQREGQSILDEASGALSRSNVPHYRELSSEERTHRLVALFDLVEQSLAQRDLIPMLQCTKSVAEQRFSDSVDIGTVQAAFNVLEETLWGRIVSRSTPEDLPEAIRDADDRPRRWQGRVGSDLRRVGVEATRPLSRPACALPRRPLTAGADHRDGA
jgi:hypothetical protein